MFHVGHPSGLQFELSLDPAAGGGRADSATFGRLGVWLGEDLGWGRFDDNLNIHGVEWYWVELLEHLASNWRYLRYEPGYPFGMMPHNPSGLASELQRRWSQPGMDEVAEDELVYAFRSSHNLALALNGCVVPDLWFVREGHVAVIECKNRVRRCPHQRELQTLESLGDYLCQSISQLPDSRSLQVREAWHQRNHISFEETLRLLTAESPSRLDELAAGENYETAFADPLAARVEDNRSIDVVYRCKGRAPVSAIRQLIRRIPQQQSQTNPLLRDLSGRLREELDSLVESGYPAHVQGRKLALSIRHNRALFPDRGDRAEPKELLVRLGATVERQALDTRSLDAVAVWGHDTGPWVIVNDHAKHATNIGAERATIAHELCHLLVDRQDVLPLGAVVGGVMDRAAEQRANAFAAELLCPRFFLRQVFEQLMSARTVIDEATRHFGVSRELAALQLARADCHLSAADRREIESCVSPDASLPW